MSSGIQSNPGILGRMVNVLAGKLGSKDGQPQAMGRIARLGMSERQLDLSHLWGVYRGQQYAHRKLDWNGRENLDRQASDVVSTQGFIPPGFHDASRQTSNAFPLKFRRPSAPYSLIKVVVDRFTGLLFSEQQHPEVKVDGDPATEDWLRALVDSARLWQQMIQARTYGGAMGTAVVGFQFINGRPVIEVHDPKWMFPEFAEYGSTTLLQVEKRYRYPKEERDPATGRWEKREYWYRRLIDETSDVLFEPAPVGQGDEPEWVEAKRVDHGFGFCPVVWVQNLPVQDCEDGDPDCPGAVYENTEVIDTLISQANRAILANGDPQLVLTTKAEMADVKLGLDSAIRVPEGDAKYLEIQASGPKAALELAEMLRKHVLEMSQCMLEHPDVAGKTATEVERMYQSMLAKADVLREQYGQKCILPLLEMLYRAAVHLGKPRALPQEPGLGQLPPEATQTDGVPAESIPAGAAPGVPAEGGEVMEGFIQQRATVVRGAVVLPPRYEKDEMGNPVAIERTPGMGGTISLKWPGYFQPTLTDVQLAATAAAGAQAAGLIDDETAIGFVAPYFKVEDKAGLVDKVRANAAQQSADVMSMMASAQAPGGVPGQEPPQF